MPLKTDDPHVLLVESVFLSKAYNETSTTTPPSPSVSVTKLQKRITLPHKISLFSYFLYLFSLITYPEPTKSLLIPRNFGKNRYFFKRISMKIVTCFDPGRSRPGRAIKIATHNKRNSIKNRYFFPSRPPPARPGNQNRYFLKGI